MPNTCLMPDKIIEFKKALKKKRIKISDLIDPKITSEMRTKIFEEYAGKNAKM